MDENARRVPTTCCYEKALRDQKFGVFQKTIFTLKQWVERFVRL